MSQILARPLFVRCTAHGLSFVRLRYVLNLSIDCILHKRMSYNMLIKNFVDHCLVPKVFMGKFPAKEWEWLVIEWSDDERGVMDRQRSCKNLIGMHLIMTLSKVLQHMYYSGYSTMHLMHPNYCQITILLKVDLRSSLAYFMLNHSIPTAGKLPVVARQLVTIRITCYMYLQFLVTKWYMLAI